MRPTFGGDAIDRMLEAGTHQSYHHGGPPQYNAVPPPSQHSGPPRSRYDRYDRVRNNGPPNGPPRNNRPQSRSRERDNRGNGGYRGRGGYNDRGRRRGGHRGGGRRGRPGDNDYYYNHRPRSMSPPNRYLTREEEELRRQEREKQDIERDQRTVFACQIHPKCDERDIFEFFSDIGKVIDVQLIRDNRTFKSKGLCYVEFEDKSSVASALSLSGQPLGGFPVSVQLTQAEKNRAAQQAAQIQQQSRPMKLYVSNIHIKVTEEDIRPVFSAFGEILSLEIKLDHRHKSKGYGFVEFKKEIDAIGAMQQLNDLEILGQKIKVTGADNDNNMNASSHMRGTTIGASAPNQLNNNIPTAAATTTTGGVGDGNNNYQTKISVDEGNGGLSLSTADKLSLMRKLGRGTVQPQHTSNTVAGVGVGVGVGAAVASQAPISSIIKPGQPLHYSKYSSFNNTVNMYNKQTGNINDNRCVLLSNMFNPLTETDPDFDLEIREDVCEEVSKFGKLLHIYVDKISKQGLVYLKFDKPHQATMCINNLNGRWFAKNQIKAKYNDENTYNKQFQL